MQKRCNGAKRNGIFSNLQLARTCSGKCLQQIYQRNATTSNCRIMAKSHPAGMRICYATFAGISLRLCYVSLRSFRITFAAYLPTHIKSLWDFLAHNSGTILNINHLARTRNIASLPCKIVLGDSLFVTALSFKIKVEAQYPLPGSLRIGAT